MTTNTAPTAGPFVVRKLRELDGVLGETLPRVLAESDPEAIHDMRVSIRRLRTLLKMSRQLFGRWHTDVVRRAYAEVTRVTGELRDEEVLEATLSEACHHPAFVTWVRARRVRERKLRRAVMRRIERGALDRARVMQKALLVFPIDPERDIELARFARRTVERARRSVESRRDVPTSDAKALHDLRIAYKELRYSIELLTEALPLDARAMLEPAVIFQKRLGEIHDADVALDVVRAARTLPRDARDQALAGIARLRERQLSKYVRELDPIAAAAAVAAAAEAAAVSRDLPETAGKPDFERREAPELDPR